MAEREHKTCTLCQASKSLDSYAKSPSSAGGLRAQCRDCINAKRRAKYLADGDAARTRNRESYHRNKSIQSGRVRTLRKYGLTLEMYEKLLSDQGGACRGCSTIPPLGINLQVDHDHGCCPGNTSCGMCVRGLLCMKCNTILGKAGDNPEVLRALAKYLEGGEF